MAWQLKNFNVGQLVANADLSLKQFYLVKMDTTNNQIALCSVADEVVFGVLQNDPASGEAADVMLVGISKVVAGETLAAGDLYGTDANGKAKKIEGTITGADLGAHVAGQVIQGAAANELAVVSIGIHTHRIETQ